MKKSNKNLTWQEVYKLPLRQEEACPFMIMTSDNQRAFDFEWPAWENYDKYNAILKKVTNQIIDKDHPATIQIAETETEPEP